MVEKTGLANPLLEPNGAELAQQQYFFALPHTISPKENGSIMEFRFNTIYRF